MESDSEFSNNFKYQRYLDYQSADHSKKVYMPLIKIWCPSAPMKVNAPIKNTSKRKIHFTLKLDMRSVPGKTIVINKSVTQK